MIVATFAEYPLCTKYVFCCTLLLQAHSFPVSACSGCDGNMLVLCMHVGCPASTTDSTSLSLVEQERICNHVTAAQGFDASPTGQAIRDCIDAGDQGLYLCRQGWHAVHLNIISLKESCLASFDAYIKALKSDNVYWRRSKLAFCVL